MQYIPLTVHLNALAQLYQQCANLSEKHDRLAKGMDIFNTEINQLNIVQMNDQERVLQEQNTEAPQDQDLIPFKSNSPSLSQNTPMQIDLLSNENDLNENLNEQGTKPIQNETKKIKKNKINVENQKFLQCKDCNKLLRSIAGLKRHQTRMHSDKATKNVTKKVQNKNQIGNKIQN